MFYCSLRKRRSKSKALPCQSKYERDARHVLYVNVGPGKQIQVSDKLKRKQSVPTNPTNYKHKIK